MKQSLLQQYPYKIELHAHSSPASRCSEVSPEELVDTYAKLGYDGLVLTNHFYIANFVGMTGAEAVERHLSDYERACKAAETLGIRVYLGAEVRFSEHPNDYLIYGVDAAILSAVFDYLEKGMGAFRQAVPLKNSLFVQAHPFRSPSEPADPALLDGVEVFNLHPNHNSRIALAQAYAKEHPQLIRTAGSDYHHPIPGHAGNTALRTRVLPEDSFALAELLRSGDYLLTAGETILL